MINARELFGDIDIYLFDQILKGRFNVDMSILDAGCGSGRNLIYFLRGGFRVFAVDQNPQAIEQIRLLAKTLNPNLPSENFQLSSVEKMPFQDEQFDAVISSAVLHFAENSEHFQTMLAEMWRVLKPKGIFFARLASSIGIEKLIKPTGNDRYLLPDGSERFLVNEEMLTSAITRFGGIWLEPLKTTNVQNLRCMTTWVLQKDN
jgi:ubiquinone/menaquinone biosynthesis C-methylase UbiE